MNTVSQDWQVMGMLSPRVRFLRGRVFLLISLTAAANLASAQDSPPATPPAAVPYSLPWQLRPMAVGTVLRFDSSIASWQNQTGRDGTTWVTGLIGARKISPRVALLGRLSVVGSHPPGGGPEVTGTAVSNPLIGATFLRTRPGGRRAALFGAMTLPVGSGGGDSPHPGRSAALGRAIPTRSAMDNALFAVNYFTLIGGASVARITEGGTLQAEATVLQLFRVRGPASQDAKRTNFTAGIHLGRSFQKAISAGVDLRYQRWLSDASPARANPQARETVTLAFGPRFHFKAGGSKWIRPGVSFSLPLDQPLSDQRYRILQLDVPVSF